MLSLLKRSKELHLGVPMVPTTDYINTIASENEPEFPGDEEIERALPRLDPVERRDHGATVRSAPVSASGGHISTYASSAALYEVGFNHFFKGADKPGRRRPDLHPGSRLPRHLRPLLPRRTPERGPARPASARRSRTRRTASPPIRTRA